MPDTRSHPLPDLIARIAQGDRRAFDAFYDATSAQANALCLSVLKDRRAAEEALEQVYIQVWRQAGAGTGGLSPQAWLTTLVRTQAMAGREGGPARPATPVAAALTDPVVAVRQVYLEGLSLADFADHTGLSAETAHQHLHAGLADMGAAFEGPEDGQAAEMALGLRRAGDPALQARLLHWQEKLAALAGNLTPVMAPARARQRIREALGHGQPPLSVDPAARRPRWRGAVLVALMALAAALAWYLTRA